MTNISVVLRFSSKSKIFCLFEAAAWKNENVILQQESLYMMKKIFLLTSSKKGNLRASDWELSRDPKDLVQCFANWHTKAVAKSLATSSAFMIEYKCQMFVE